MSSLAFSSANILASLDSTAAMPSSTLPRACTDSYTGFCSTVFGVSSLGVNAFNLPKILYMLLLMIIFLLG